jgi:hypothetical protein
MSSACIKCSPACNQEPRNCLILDRFHSYKIKFHLSEVSFNIFPLISQNSLLYPPTPVMPPWHRFILCVDASSSWKPVHLDYATSQCPVMLGEAQGTGNYQLMPTLQEKVKDARVSSAMALLSVK